MPSAAAKPIPPFGLKTVFPPLGIFWPGLCYTVLASVVIGGILAAAWSPVASAIFAGYAIWSVVFFGSLGVIVGGFIQPMSPKHQAVVLLAVFVKIIAFLCAIVSVDMLVDVVQAQPMLIVPILVGLHTIPVTMMVVWIGRLATTPSPASGRSDGNPAQSHQVLGKPADEASPLAGR